MLLLLLLLLITMLMAYTQLTGLAIAISNIFIQQAIEIMESLGNEEIAG